MQRWNWPRCQCRQDDVVRGEFSGHQNMRRSQSCCSPMSYARPLAALTHHSEGNTPSYTACFEVVARAMIPGTAEQSFARIPRGFTSVTQVLRQRGARQAQVAPDVCNSNGEHATSARNGGHLVLLFSTKQEACFDILHKVMQVQPAPLTG